MYVSPPDTGDKEHVPFLQAKDEGCQWHQWVSSYSKEEYHIKNILVCNTSLMQVGALPPMKN